MNIKFNHVHLICSDLEEMTFFLTDVLGAEFITHCKFGKAEGASLKIGEVVINLRLPTGDEKFSVECPPSHFGYHHIGVEVKDLDAAYQQLVDKGFEFTKKPGMGAKIRNAFFRGPDGILIEVMEIS